MFLFILQQYFGCLSLLSFETQTAEYNSILGACVSGQFDRALFE